MSIGEAFYSTVEKGSAVRDGNRQRWRLPLLCLLLLASLGFTVWLRVTAPPIDSDTSSFVTLWLVSFLPYLAACLLILTKKPLAGRGRLLELGVILGGALVLRAILLPMPPNLSHDSWRYVWDARVTVHGYSPYVYAPNDPTLLHLRNFIFDNSRFRNVPTLYPPAAQAIYLLSYLVAPDNLFVLKGVLVALDLGTCCVLALVLAARGLDPARCIVYAWCPLPILEFAIQGHHEAITLLFTALALLTARSTRRGSRVLTGGLIALATLTNIYPILLLLVVLRFSPADLLAQQRFERTLSARSFMGNVLRGIMLLISAGLRSCKRDWMLLTTCFVTIVLAYVPYLILGHGHAFGFFGTYVSEESMNAGPVLLVGRWLGYAFGFKATTALLPGYLFAMLVIGGVVLVVLWRRIAGRMSMEVATLLLIAAVFACSTHIFPWYATALLPWIAVALRPLYSSFALSRLSTAERGLDGAGLAAAFAWYFPCIIVIHYFFDHLKRWEGYYVLSYGVVIGGLVVAMIVGRKRKRV